MLSARMLVITWLSCTGALSTDGVVRSGIHRPAAVAATRSRARTAVMADGKKPLVPQGPLGGYRRPGEDRFDGKWVGDRSRSIQIKKFEEGEDYLFFQGPAPLSAVQEDLPDFFSKENVDEIIGNLKITPLRLAIGAVGLSAFAVIAGSVVFAPGSKSPFEFLDFAYPPAIAAKKVEAVQLAKAKEAEAAAAAKKKAEAAAKKAEAQKPVEAKKA